jgi:hypothetical protein
MSGPELVLVLRYRKAVTYGFHALLGALGQHETATRYEVRFGESVEETARHVREAGDVRTLVLWSSILRTPRLSARSCSRSGPWRTART